MTPPQAPDPEENVPTPGRLWRADEANRRLPGLRERLPELRGWVLRLRSVKEEFDRLAAFWGKELDSPDHPDKALQARLQSEWTGLTERLEREVAALQSEGIEVKDLDSGLIDFYGVVDGEVVFLCWKLGEEEVAHFHRLDGGYRSRRPLPDGPAHLPARPGGTP
ncbi:MAG TPA: DUF2203 domain-containing protein [Thermoplasmata archaeon]|nr:DUF2203 domain-containing protein [Thermoplasmata archaeon]